MTEKTMVSVRNGHLRCPGAAAMPKLGLCDEVKWSLVGVPLAVFLVVTAAAFWSMTTIPQQRALHLNVEQGAVPTLSSAFDCDVCVVLYTGDDGSTKPSETNLPFPLVRRLFQAVDMIEMPAQREKIVCVGVDHPAIPCRMARDALGPDVNCWGFKQPHPLIPAPVRCDHMVVGNTSQHLPQLAMFENQTSGSFTLRQMHVVQLDNIPPQSQAPALQHVRPTVVTGFSANHLSAGLLLLRSIAKAASDARETKPEFALSVVVWEMDEFRGRDKDDLECVVREMKETSAVDVEVRRFKFWAFPGWTRIKQRQQTGSFDDNGTGEYAWKVVMIHTVLVERGLMLWTDAGDRFRTKESLTETLDYIAEHGFASRRSSGDIRQWTRKEALLYLRATHLNVSSPNCDGSAVGFTLEKYEELAWPWYECALTRQCIAPDGSNRRNHRQDQAALTVLAYLSGDSCTGIHGDVGRHMDGSLGDVVGAAKSSCYTDPRNYADLLGAVLNLEIAPGSPVELEIVEEVAGEAV